MRYEREQALAEPLIRWLHQRGWIRHDSLVAEEVPWCGRRVDVATLNASRTARSFELKLTDNGRAIEQAAYNALSFDRSYIVTASYPRAANIDRAQAYGVGIIHVSPAGDVTMVSPAADRDVPAAARRRLLTVLKRRGRVAANV